MDYETFHQGTKPSPSLGPTPRALIPYQSRSMRVTAPGVGTSCSIWDVLTWVRFKLPALMPNCEPWLYY